MTTTLRPETGGQETAAPTSDGPVVLFDGVCNFCSRSVQFVLARDRGQRFRFAPLQSAAGQRILKRCSLASEPLATIVLAEGDRCHTRSTAALRICRGLSGAWPLLSVLLVIPRPIRDRCYDWFAARRYRWFGRREACFVPSEEMRGRFLDEIAKDAGGTT